MTVMGYYDFIFSTTPEKLIHRFVGASQPPSPSSIAPATSPRSISPNISRTSFLLSLGSPKKSVASGAGSSPFFSPIISSAAGASAPEVEPLQLASDAPVITTSDGTKKRAQSDTTALHIQKLELAEAKQEQAGPQIVSLPELPTLRADDRVDGVFHDNPHARGLQNLRQRYEEFAQQRYQVSCFASNHLHVLCDGYAAKEDGVLTDDPLLYAVMYGLKKRHEAICTFEPKTVFGAYAEHKNSYIADLCMKQRQALDLMRYSTGLLTCGRLKIKERKPLGLFAFARGINYELLGKKFLAQEENKHLLMFVKSMYASKAKSSEGRLLLHTFLGLSVGQELIRDFYERYQYYGKLKRQVGDVVIPSNDLSDQLSDGLRACEEIKLLIAVAMKSWQEFRSQQADGLS